MHYNASLAANHWFKQKRTGCPKLRLVEHLLQLYTISMIDHWEQPSDVCCLKMTALNCSIYHKFLKALVYKKDHHAKSGQRLQIRPKKYFLLQKRDWRQTICRFRVIESTCCTHESPGWKPDRLQVRSLLSSEWLKRVKDDFFKSLTTNRQKWHWLVIFYLLL